MEENNILKEEVEETKTKVNAISNKLGISVEDRVPKTKIVSKLEMFSLLQKREFSKDDEEDYEYYTICGQVNYTKYKAKNMVDNGEYKEILRIEYAPNTKNLLHRLKEKKYKIKFASNKFNTDLSPETLIEYIREIQEHRKEINL